SDGNAASAKVALLAPTGHPVRPDQSAAAESHRRTPPCRLLRHKPYRPAARAAPKPAPGGRRDRGTDSATSLPDRQHRAPAGCHARWSPHAVEPECPAPLPVNRPCRVHSTADGYYQASALVTGSFVPAG